MKSLRVAVTAMTIAAVPGHQASGEIGTAIAVGSLVVSAIGGIFGSKSAAAAAKARQEQFNALLKELAAIDEAIAANRILLEGVLSKLDGLEDRIVLLSLHTGATSAAARLYTDVAVLEESGFKLTAVEEEVTLTRLSRTLDELERANTAYREKILDTNDLALIPRYVANADALFTAYHLLGLLSAENEADRALQETSFSKGEATCAEYAEALGLTLEDVVCADQSYSSIMDGSFSVLRMSAMVRETADTLSRFVSFNLNPATPFSDQNDVVSRTCSAGHLRVSSQDGSIDTKVAEAGMRQDQIVRFSGPDDFGVRTLDFSIKFYDRYEFQTGHLSTKVFWRDWGVAYFSIPVLPEDDRFRLDIENSSLEIVPPYWQEQDMWPDDWLDRFPFPYAGEDRCFNVNTSGSMGAKIEIDQTVDRWVYLGWDEGEFEAAYESTVRKDSDDLKEIKNDLLVAGLYALQYEEEFGTPYEFQPTYSGPLYIDVLSSSEITRSVEPHTALRIHSIAAAINGWEGLKRRSASLGIEVD